MLEQWKRETTRRERALEKVDLPVVDARQIAEFPNCFRAGKHLRIQK
jgi:hypothetical protein